MNQKRNFYRVIVGLILLLTPILAFGQFRIENETRSNLNINFENPSFQINKEMIGANEYDYISAETLTVTVDVGSPELPFYSSTIEIPNSGNATINVRIIESTQFKDVNIKPFRENDLELLTFNNEVYSKNVTYPSEVVQIGEPAIFRNKRVVSFTIHPFRYNDALNVLEVIEKAEIEFSFDNTPSVNEITRSKMKPTREFEEFFASTILNYKAPDTRDDYQNPTILYIYPSAIEGNPVMEGLFTWRREQGWNVQPASTSVTGTSSVSIKAYIQNAYDNWEDPPAFVTFIGDGQGALAVSTHNGGYSATGDHYYGLLEGNDELEDVFLGRISVETTTDLATIVSKIIKYEKANTPDPDYYTRALLTADTTPSGQSTIITSHYVKEAILNHNPDFSFVELYGDSPSPSSVSNALNTGMNFWNYRGWINMDGWGASHANALTNINKSSIAILLTCSTGTYYSGTSITEVFVRAGSAASPKGGVAAIGMATSGTHTAFNNCLNGGIMGHLFAEGGWTMGGAMGRGKHHLWQAYSVSKPSAVQTHSTLCNMIGDSSLRVFKGLPKTITAQFLENIPAETNQMKIVTNKDDDEALSNTWVTLKVNDEYISRYTDANGVIYMNIPTDATGAGKLTITKEGYEPIQQTITFGLEAPNINAGEITIISDGVEVEHLTPNATFELKIDADNVGDSDIENLSATITSGVNGVAITQGTVSYGDVTTGNSVTSSNAFQLSVANRAYDLHVPINIVFTNATDSWERQLLVPIESPVIQVSDYTIVNSNFGPGETTVLTVELFNHGNGRINLGNATLSSTDNRVVINSGEALIGAIDIDASATVSFNISAATSFLPGDLAPMTINIVDSDFQTSCYFSLTVGVASITDPLGPDAYGYYIFDSFDVGYDECPEYEWIELNPSNGGFGTQISLPDNGGNQEKVQTVDLPFDFKFYGIDYDKISICSNGWLALGETEQATHRNWRLPGVLGPSPMIAPFWDDLLTGGNGKVWIAHDQEENYFVVTWDNWKNAYSSSLEETFQVILYDPIYYQSSTGDAPVKIQYKVINNVNNSSGNTHGNYATVGIKDHTSTVGLEYTFNNQYPVAAKPLQNGLALYITTKIGQLPPYVIAQPDDIVFEEDHVDSSLDLYKIFRDPNNDELIFTFSESENLSLEANEDGYLVITPARDWFGLETVTVYASDGISESDASVSFLVTVTPVNDRPVMRGKFPEQTNFDSDSNVMYFTVDVEDVDSELTYEWRVNSVVLEGEVTDSLYYVFDTVETHSIRCYISDEDFTVIASWNVNVTTDNIAEPVIVNSLSQNAPNPFNPSTTINFSLKKSSDVSLVVYNLKGQKVKTLASEEMQQGHHSVVWNGLDEHNRPVSSGVYFYRLITDEYRSTKKAIMMK